jgi:hypothetical protein
MMAGRFLKGGVMRRLTAAARALVVGLPPYSILKTILRNQERMMHTMADVLERLNTLDAALGTVADDLRGDLAFLKGLITANPGITPEIEAAITRIEDRVQGLRGLAAETTVPAEEPPTETVDGGSGQDHAEGGEG